MGITLESSGRLTCGSERVIGSISAWPANQATRYAALEERWRAVLKRKNVLRGDRDVRIRRKTRVTQRCRLANRERRGDCGESDRRRAATVAEARAGVPVIAVVLRRRLGIGGAVVVAGVRRGGMGRVRASRAVMHQARMQERRLAE